MRSIDLAMIAQTWRLFIHGCKKAIDIGQSQGITSKRGGLGEPQNLQPHYNLSACLQIMHGMNNIWLVRVCMVNLSRSGLRTNNINQVHHLHQSAWSSTNIVMVPFGDRFRFRFRPTPPAKQPKPTTPYHDMLQCLWWLASRSRSTPSTSKIPTNKRCLFKQPHSKT